MYVEPKLKPRDRAEVYDRLCILADKLLKKFSACSSCPITAKCTLFRHKYSKSWCCGGCPHLGPSGCTVQALGCKLHLCSAEKGRQTKRGSRELQLRLYRLQRIAFHYKIWMARADKQESLEHGDKDFWYVYNVQHGYVR